MKKNRITIESLKYYVPIYQNCEKAQEKLISEKNLTIGDKNQLENMINLKEMIVKKIANLASPLIFLELRKLLSRSHIGDEHLYNVLYYAGLDGMKRGLRNFEVEKINKSSTNYLFQWFFTYAKKELLKNEAPFGIPPSRFQRYKKISAVRKKLTEEYDRYATNEEVYEYFQNGGADISTMSGKVGSNNKISKANRNIKLELIEEQEKFEKNMMNIELFDTTDEYSASNDFTNQDDDIFDETIFGVFCRNYNITKEARFVIMNDLSSVSINNDQEFFVSSEDYKKISNQWKNLIKDVNGPFYEFLKEIEIKENNQFDITKTIENIENFEKTINNKLYSILFEDGKPRRKNEQNNQ